MAELTAEEFLAKESTAMVLRGAMDAYRQKRGEPHGPGPRTTTVDKYGFGFNLDRRFTAFSVRVNLDSWTGYWGSSSCSRFLHLPDKAAAELAFVEYLNAHHYDILTGMADIIDARNGKAKQAYENELRAELARLEAPDAK